MPPRPFPLPFRVGTDIVCQSRVRDIITKEGPSRKDRTSSRLDAFLKRIFTKREIRLFWTRFDPSHFRRDVAMLPGVTAHLAGRWAAKEAAVKAVKARKLALMDIEILQQPTTRELYALIRDEPYVHPVDPSPATKRLNLASEADIALEKEHQNEHDPPGQIAILSVSHDQDYATAVCMAAEEPIPGDVGGEAAARLYYESIERS